MTREEFITKYGDEIEVEYNVTSGYIYDTYYNKIDNYKHLITKFQNSDDITIDEMLVVFGVSLKTFKICRKYFKELDLLVSHKRNIMKLKTYMNLERGIELSPSNPKLLEMQQRLHNDEWKDKSSDIEVNMPTELKVSFDDCSTVQVTKNNE